MTNPELIAKWGGRHSVLDHGFVALVDVMGDDGAIVEAARQSTSGSRSEHKPGEDGKCKVCGEETFACSIANEERPNPWGRETPWCDEGDRRFLRYMYRNGHTSPFEMCEIKLLCKMPIFVARQWVRHRTACLSADTALQFDLPGGIERRGNQLYKLTMGEVYEKFQPTENTRRPDKQGNPYFRRERVQGMHLRCVDEETGGVRHTRIVDIWESGVKQVYRVELENGAWFTCSEDHRIMTEEGWYTLGQLVDLHADAGCVQHNPAPAVVTVGPGRGTGVAPYFPAIDEDAEEWRSVVRWERYYEVSSEGRVRRIAGGRGARPGVKKRTPNDGGHLVVSMNRPGEQTTKLIHHLVLEAFTGVCPPGLEACHDDGNGFNNKVENLRWDTPQSNADDRIRDGATTALTSGSSRIAVVEPAGQEMTYDLEVEGPAHNFSANGAIVHNSLNEMSGRYTVLPDEFYMPDPERIGGQGLDNKQGTEGGMSAATAEFFRTCLNDDYTKMRKGYEVATHEGVSNELARLHTGVAQYTQWVWKIDLHNLLHFLGLRCDSHAQWEMRQYAEVIRQVVKDWVPMAYEAWDDYHPKRGAHTFSRQEMTILRSFIQASAIPDWWEWEHQRNGSATQLTKREQREFLHALNLEVGDGK